MIHKLSISGSLTPKWSFDYESTGASEPFSSTLTQKFTIILEGLFIYQKIDAGGFGDHLNFSAYPNCQ